MISWRGVQVLTPLGARIQNQMRAGSVQEERVQALQRHVCQQAGVALVWLRCSVGSCWLV